MAVEVLTTDNFKETLQNQDKIAIVDFYADWCGPCKMVSPVVEEISDENPEIAVYKVNVDENPELAGEFSVMSIPTIISFKKGEIYKQMTGARPKEDILELAK